MTHVGKKSPLRFVGFIRSLARLSNPFGKHSDVEGKNDKRDQNADTDGNVC